MCGEIEKGGFLSPSYNYELCALALTMFYNWDDLLCENIIVCLQNRHKMGEVGIILLNGCCMCYELTLIYSWSQIKVPVYRLS